jgi:hypothetical protein
MHGQNPSEPADADGAIPDATRLSRNPTLHVAKVRDEIVMMNSQGDHYFGLDDIGSDIWERIEPPCTIADLIDRLSADYDADRATIATDVMALLKRLVAEDIVRLG